MIPGNKRRLELIDKSMESSLTKEEQRELARLEIQVEKYVNKRFPLPWHMIRQLRACAKKDGIDIGAIS